MEEKVVDKIRKLLALSTSPNEAEAAAAFEKAHALLRMYNLSMADIHDAPESAVTETTIAGKSEQKWRSRLLHLVATNNYCAMAVMKGIGNFSYQIFGREANVASTLIMYDYLSKTVRRISERAREIVPNFSYVDFRFAMIERLGERMEEMRKAETAETTALVVVDTEAWDALRKAHPRMMSRRAHAYHNAESAALGRTSADSVSLSPQVTSGTRVKEIGRE